MIRFWNIYGPHPSLTVQSSRLHDLCRVILVRAISLAGLLSINCGLAWAEPFVDFYGGMALAQTTEASHQAFFPFTVPQQSPASTTQKLAFDASGTFGIRAGGWALPWLGVAADLSFFQRKAERADIDVVPLSLFVMLRWPLQASDQFPKGRLQPYVGVGPSFVYSHTSIDFGPPFGSVNHGNFFTDVGLDTRAGLAWQVFKKMAIFGEYRFLHANLDYKKRVCPPSKSLIGFGCEQDEKVTASTTDLTLNTHLVLIGIRFSLLD